MDSIAVTQVLPKLSDKGENSHQSAKSASPGIRIGSYIYFHPSIGRGASSTVYYGKNVDSGESVAVKRISRGKFKRGELVRVENEIDLMKRLVHPNIVSYRDVLSDVYYIYIITEYCNGGTLDQFIQDHRGYPENFPESEVKIYMTQIRDAFKYLLDQNIYHRDIKPHNIFISRTGSDSLSDPRLVVLKIGDFGLAKEIVDTDDMNNTLCGTPMYIAPEIIYGRCFHSNSDLWSIGIILFQLLYGYFPFSTPKNVVELIRSIDATILVFPLPSETTHLSYNVYDLLRGLLDRDYKSRMSWEDFFTHRWWTIDLIDESPVDMMDTAYIVDAIVYPSLLDDLYGIPSKVLVDDTRKKFTGRINLVENYLTVKSIDKKNTQTHDRETRAAHLTYPNLKSDASPADKVHLISSSIYRYISHSIYNIKSFTYPLV